MSIVWCHELNTSEDLKLDLAPGNQKLEIVRKFQILTDSMDDGPITVCSCDDLPTPFSFYSKGNDYADYCVATTCDAKRDKNQPLLWHVTVGYTSAVEFDPSGSMSGSVDLTCFLPSARSWKVAVDRIVWNARPQLPAIAGTGNVADTFAVTMAKDSQPIVNSCGKYFTDGISTTKYIRAWEIRRYQWYFVEGEADAYADVVNKTSFWGHDAGTVRMAAITGDRQTVNNALIWLVSYEFHISPDGWGQEIGDNGMERWCTATGAVPASLGDATGQSVIKDAMGEDIQSPVLLNGKGYVSPFVSEPVIPGGPAVIVKWHHLEEKEFADLAWPLPTKASLHIL